MTIKAIKGFDSDFKCRGFQFEAGRTYTHEGYVRACESGFHAIPDDLHPLTVFQFYPPAGSRFALVEVSGATDREENKIAAEILSVGREVGLRDLTLAAVEFVTSRAKHEGPVAVNDSGLATASGTRGAATASGEMSSAHATAEGGRVMAEVDGCSLFAREVVWRDSKYELVGVACGISGRDGIKPGVWYHCTCGKLTEAAA